MCKVYGQVLRESPAREAGETFLGPAPQKAAHLPPRFGHAFATPYPPFAYFTQ